MKKDLVQMSRGDAAVGVLIGSVVACLAGLMIGAMGWMLGAAAAFVTSTERHRLRRNLQLRIDHPADLEWDVVVNNVRVGTLPDAAYAEIEKAVVEDWRVYVAQARNLLRVVGRAADTLVVAIPATLFWLGLAFMFVDPQAATSLVEALRSAPPADIFAAVAQYSSVGAFVIVVAMLLAMMVTSSRGGDENVFQDRIADAVRCRVQAAPVGRVMLVPVPGHAVATSRVTE